MFVLTLGAYFTLPTHYTVSADLSAHGRASTSLDEPAGADASALQTDLAGALVSDVVTGAVVDRVGAGRLLGARPSGSPRVEAIAQVQHALGLAPRDPPGVYTLSFFTTDPRLGTDVVNDLMSRLAATHPPGGRSEPDTRASVEAAERAQAQADEALTRARDLTALEANSQALAEQTRSALQAQVATAQSEQTAAVAAAAAAQLSKGDPRTADTAELLRLRAVRTSLAAKQDDLGRRYGPLHPQMLEVGQQLHDLDAQIATETRLSQMLATDLMQARAHLAGLQASLKLSQQLVAAYAAHTTVQITPPSQAATTRTQSEALSATHPPAPQAAAPLTVHPLSAAHVVAARRAVPFLLAVLGAALLAGVTSGAVVYARDRKDRGFHGADDVERLLGLPLTASVPEVEDVLAAASPRPVSGPTSPTAASRGEKGLADAFLSLCKSLGIAQVAGSTRCIAVCSAVAGEGKTTSSLCLARTAAEMGLRVVVIDCDGRGQALSRQAAAATGPGLVQVLRGQAAPEQAVVADRPHGPWLMRHSATSEIGDLSDTRRLRDLIAKLASAYDLVVLDTAPVLALAEARVVAALAERVLLVARWRKTPVGATRMSLDLLNRAGAQVAAFALTLVQPSAGLG